MATSSIFIGRAARYVPMNASAAFRLPRRTCVVVSREQLRLTFFDEARRAADNVGRDELEGVLVSLPQHDFLSVDPARAEWHS